MLELKFAPAQNEKEWQALMHSDAPGLIRSRTQWEAFVREARQKEGHIVSLIDDNNLMEFGDSLVFMNGGLAGASYGILLKAGLSLPDVLPIFEYFGIGRFLFPDYEDKRCAGRGTCSYSITDTCTSNCYYSDDDGDTLIGDDTNPTWWPPKLWELIKLSTQLSDPVRQSKGGSHPSPTEISSIVNDVLLALDMHISAYSLNDDNDSILRATGEKLEATVQRLVALRRTS